MKSSDTTSIQVIDRATQLLVAIAGNAPASLKFLAADCMLHPSTAHRILASLIDNGLVARDPNGQYQLGSRLLQLASQVRTQVDLRREALPIMEGLRNMLGETINLTVRDGDEVVYVERVSSQKAVRVEQVIGGRAPLHVTAVGKLFLGFEGQSATLDYARRSGLPPLTPYSLKHPEALWTAAQEARARGFALDNEEADPGVGCIAVPILDASGRMVAGLSVSAPIERRQLAWTEQVKATGQAISRLLGARE